MSLFTDVAGGVFLIQSRGICCRANPVIFTPPYRKLVRSSDSIAYSQYQSNIFKGLTKWKQFVVFNTKKVDDNRFKSLSIEDVKSFSKKDDVRQSMVPFNDKCFQIEKRRRWTIDCLKYRRHRNFYGLQRLCLTMSWVIMKVDNPSSIVIKRSVNWQISRIAIPIRL